MAVLRRQWAKVWGMRIAVGKALLNPLGDSGDNLTPIPSLHPLTPVYAAERSDLTVSQYERGLAVLSFGRTQQTAL